MQNTFIEAITNLKKSRDRNLIAQDFSNQMISEQEIQCFMLGEIKFLNCQFQNVDFTGSWFVDCLFENCSFKNTTFRKCQCWDCIFKNTQISDSDLTRSEFDSSFFENSRVFKSDLRAAYFFESTFKKTTFSQSNLDLILVDDVKVWESKKWIEIHDFSSFETDKKNTLRDS